MTPQPKPLRSGHAPVNGIYTTGGRTAVSGESMRKADQHAQDPDMRSHYDFSGGVRGKYAGRFSGNCTVVVLEPDVAEMFPDTASVNETLREVIAMRAKVPGGDK